METDMKGIKEEPYDDEAREIDLEAFKSCLEKITWFVQDPRAKDNQKHSLFTLVAITFCAIVGGANSISAIYRYASSKRKWLMTWLDLRDDIPSYDTFWWLLVRLDPSQTEMLFRQWSTTLSKDEIEDLIAIDGKRVRGASNKKNQPDSLLHMVSAWSSGRGLVLGQVKTETKSNEITAIPELIQDLDIKDATITIDAMGCQKEIARVVIEKGANYVLMVKDNQSTLFDEIQNYFEQAESLKFEDVPHNSFVKEEEGHGRQERREVYATDDIDWLPMKEEWIGLKSIVMLKSFRSLKGITSEERRYYISSLPPLAERIARAARSHWGIENKVHWVLDVDFHEDLSQISMGHAAENFSILRRLTLNIIRLDPDKKKSLKGRREIAGWDNDYMSYLLGLAAIKKF
jgi:predicted transposase YbfD/YdcC